jgi:hypothetical protein
LDKLKPVLQFVKTNRVRIIIGGMLCFGLLGFGGYWYAERIMQEKIQRSIAQLKEKKGLILAAESIKLTGIGVVSILQLTITDTSAKQVARLKEMKVGVRLLPLLKGRTVIDRIEASNGEIFYPRDPNKSNQNNDKSANKIDLADKASNHWNIRDLLANFADKIEELAEKIPPKIAISQVQVHFQREKDTLKLALNQINLVDSDCKGEVQYQNRSYQLSGMLDPEALACSLHIKTDSLAFVPLPFLDNNNDSIAYGFGCRHVQIIIDDYDNGFTESTIEGKIAAYNLKALVPQLHTDTVSMDSVGFAYSLRFSDNSFQLEKPSVLFVNGISTMVELALNVQKDSKDTILTAQIDAVNQDAGQFFRSLPKGAFHHLTGIAAIGKLNLSLGASHTMNKPDLFKLKLSTNHQGFKVTQLGNTDFESLNSRWTYVPYWNPDQRIAIGPDAPGYVLLKDISPYLRASTIAAEDPNFNKHKGISVDGARLAVIENMKKKKFSRGGSTITMQLVKNLFLTPKKTLCRKLEEWIIASLIEDQKIADKNRILELYLNIIEWGPNIYGCREAAQFYFAKTPVQLTPDEALFLTLIIPQPKKFATFFDDYAQVHGHHQGFFQYYAAKMNEYGVSVSPGSVSVHQVALRGRARAYVGNAAAIYSLQRDRTTKQMIFNNIEEKIENKLKFEY